MDTKLKNIKSKYSSYIVYGLIIILSSSIFLSLTDIINNYRYLSVKKTYMTGQLNHEIENYISKVMDYTLFYKSEEYVKDKNNITQDDIYICKDEIRDKINSEINDEVNLLYDSESFEELSYDDREKKVLEIKNKVEEKYNYTDEQLEQYILERKLKSYKTLFNEINSYKNLNFSIYDETNKKWINNEQKNLNRLKYNSSFFEQVNIAPNGNITKTVFVNGEEVSENDYYLNGYYSGPYESTIEERYGIDNYGASSNTNISIYIWIPIQIQQGDSIYTALLISNENRNRLFIDSIVLFVSVLILLVIAKSLRKENSINYLVDKISNKIKEYPIEYKLAVGLISWIMYIILTRTIYYGEYKTRLIIWNVILTSIIFVILHVLVRDIYLNYKEGTLLKNNISVELWGQIQILMKNGSIFRSILLMFLIYCTIVGILLFIAVVLDLFVLFLIAGIIVTIIFIVVGIKKLAYLEKIMDGAKDGAEGRLTYNIEEKGQGRFRDLAHNINNIKEGLRESIQNEVKSERMKTELITNVSHDLKTPLTSIINYIDLLKRENIEPEEARDYVNVLDNKAKRLKVLIEDLFEVSKAASGSMELNIERIEIIQLLKQVLGENDERIKDSDLKLRVNVPEEKIYISGDGKRLYRVFENLISNVIKYSLSNTRVYIDITRVEEDVKISIKNIASYELNFDVNEITERFKRADESRTSEGSGLGLAIAKSIIELHKGELHIEVDGDLFKATIYLKT